VSSTPDHWPLHARAWSLVGPPLRPCAEDIAIVEREVGRAGRTDMLVLGVTPELVALALPEGSTVIAVDKQPAMIDALFAPAPHRRALVGEWLALPLADASIDLVVGDGGLSVFAFPVDYRAFAIELARVLRPGALVVVRLFAAPRDPESLDDVRAALPSIGSFDALKWRIAMAIQSPDRAVRVTAIRDAFDALVPDRAALAERTGWSRDVIDHIDIYRDSPAIYSFPTLDEVRAVLAPQFTEVACHVPGYELGDRCPTLVLRYSSTSALPASR
jgi:SAM-dependent methyltransferase